MIVAIIDDGICQDEISSVVEVHFAGKKSSDFRQMDHESHGTVCAKIIEKYSSPDKIIDIPFLDGHDKADLSDMCDALECCLDLNVDIINLSCGSAFYNPNTEEYDRLYNVCRKLYYRGIKIFAAQNNGGKLTIPARFPYVTSVERLGKANYEMISLYRKSDILAESVHSIVLNGKSVKTEACNSYACAYATACEMTGNSMESEGVKKSYTINAGLSLYNFKALNDNVYELYLDDIPKAIGRLYFHDIFESEQKYLEKNNIRSLVLSDNANVIETIRKFGGKYEETDVPFIFIEKNENAIEAALKLNSRFLDNMYKSCVISSDMRDSFYDAIYSPDKCIDSFAKLLAKYNSCNVVIIICSFSQKKNDDDVYISFNNGITMMWDNNEKNIKETDDLYDEIIKLL